MRNLTRCTLGYILILLTCASCVRGWPDDLRVEDVFRTDRTELPVSRYKINVESGLVGALGIAVVVSTSASFRLSAGVLDWFCSASTEDGQQKYAVLRDPSLYRIIAKPGDTTSIGRDGQRQRYVILMDIRGRKIRFLDADMVDYDLAHETRDICLRTEYSEEYVRSESNIVRLSRAEIERALTGAVRPLPEIQPY